MVNGEGRKWAGSPGPMEIGGVHTFMQASCLQTPPGTPRKTGQNPKRDVSYDADARGVYSSLVGWPRNSREHFSSSIEQKCSMKGWRWGKGHKYCYP